MQESHDPAELGTPCIASRFFAKCLSGPNGGDRDDSWSPCKYPPARQKQPSRKQTKLVIGFNYRSASLSVVGRVISTVLQSDQAQQRLFNQTVA